MNKKLRVLFSIPIFIVVLCVLMVNTKLYFKPAITIIGNDTLNNDLLQALHGLKKAMHSNADRNMQHLYPEGYVFMNALYSLSWYNAIENIDHTAELFKEGQQEIAMAFAKINSDEGRAPFTKDLPLEYGGFYAGWSSYVLGKKLSLETMEKRDTNEVKFFTEKCKAIAASLEEHLYPASYYGSTWPADGVLCVASLALHDKIFQPAYTDLIDRWVKRVRLNLDSKGMLAHAVSPANDTPIVDSRG